MSETLIRHLRIGICDDKCRAMEARSGCMCAEAADTIERMQAAIAFVRSRSSPASEILNEFDATYKCGVE